MKLENLGKRIKSARWKREYTQKELAKHLGVCQSHLCEIEKGKKYPSIEMLWEIEKILETDVWKTT